MKNHTCFTESMRRIFLLLTLLCLFPATGCKRIPLYDPLSDVYLKLNLKLNTDVKLNDDIDLEGDAALREKVYGKMPEQVRACFYDTQTHALMAEEFLPPTGGFINVPAGTYDIIVYSLGTEATRVEGTASRAGANAFTSQLGITIKAKNNANPSEESTIGHQPVIYEPDHIFVGTKENVIIPIHSEIDKTHYIEMEMTTLLETYSLEVRNIEGAERIKSIDVYITGQAPSKHMWDRRFPSKISAIYFPSEPKAEEDRLYTVFNTFGKFPGAHNDVILNVIVTGVDGGQYQFTYDVTDQFDNPDNINHALIIDDEKIVIPDKNAGGFRPDVKDWDIEIIPVPIN